MLTASGATGKLLTGGRLAASLAHWQMQSQGGCCEVAASIAWSDAYYIEHAKGFDLSLDVGRRRWVWRDVIVEIEGNTATIIAGGRRTVE